MNSFISSYYTLGNSQTIDLNWNYENVLIPDNKFCVLEKGEIEIGFNGEVLHVKAGEMVLIPGNLNHSVKLHNCSSAKKTWIHFNLKRGLADFFSCYDRPVKVILPNKTHALSVMKDVIASSKLDEPFRSLKTSSGIFELVCIFLSECAPITQTSHLSNIERAISYIDANFTEQLSLLELSERYGCSPNHFIKKFKEKTGYTPIKYLLMKKIDLSKNLLATTTLPISEIMEKAGFYDASYFSKLFKKTVGYSPREYRDNL